MTKPIDPYILGPLDAVNIKEIPYNGTQHNAICIACNRVAKGGLSIYYDITNGDVYDQDTPEDILTEREIDAFPIGPDCLAKVRRVYPKA